MQRLDIGDTVIQKGKKFTVVSIDKEKGEITLAGETEAASHKTVRWWI